MSHKIHSKEKYIVKREKVYMSNFVDFLLEFLKQFFGYLWSIFAGIFTGIFQMFNVPRYVEIFKQYCGEFNALAWILAILVVIFLIAALAGLGKYFFLHRVSPFRYVLLPNSIQPQRQVQLNTAENAVAIFSDFS